MPFTTRFLKRRRKTGIAPSIAALLRNGDCPSSSRQMRRGFRSRERDSPHFVAKPFNHPDFAESRAQAFARKSPSGEGVDSAWNGAADMTSEMDAREIDGAPAYDAIYESIVREHLRQQGLGEGFLKRVAQRF